MWFRGRMLSEESGYWWETGEHWRGKDMEIGIVTSDAICEERSWFILLHFR